jgi:hypothetical protein
MYAHVIANKSTRKKTSVPIVDAVPQMCVRSPSSEEAIAGVAESGKDVAVLVEFAIERGADDRNIGMRVVHALDSGRRGDETEKSNTLGTGALQRVDCGDGTSAGREHRIEQQELALGRIAGNLEVVVDRFERVVIAIESDMSDARRRHEFEDALDHSESGPEDRDERELLTGDPLADGSLERRLDSDILEREVGRRLVGHQHRDLVDELLEDLRRRAAIAENRDLVLDERMADERQSGKRRGSRHGDDSSIFAYMKEYQAVILRFSHHTRDDEDALTDLLNERSRGGWEPAMMTQDEVRVTIVFSRRAEPER